jgi:hypothetical protein
MRRTTRGSVTSATYIDGAHTALEGLQRAGRPCPEGLDDLRHMGKHARQRCAMPEAVKLTKDQRVRARRLCRALEIDLRLMKDQVGGVRISNDEILVLGLRNTISALGNQLVVELDDSDDANQLREDLATLRSERVL